jgi:hypothetical protein
MNIKRRAALSFLLSPPLNVASRTARAAPPGAVFNGGPYQVHSVLFYQPPAVLVARLGAHSEPQMGAYIARINAAVAPLFAAAPPQPGVTGALVIGLKPGGAVRTWIAEHPGALPDALAATIESTIDALPPVPVQNGPVAFAIRFDAWGGGAPITDAAHPAPVPDAWLKVATGPETVPDGVFARIWP